MLCAAAGSSKVATTDALKYFAAVCEASAPSFGNAAALAQKAGLIKDGSTFSHPEVSISIELITNSYGQPICSLKFATTDRKNKVLTSIKDLPTIQVRGDQNSPLLYHSNPKVVAAFGGTENRNEYVLFLIGQ
jgi:hypothetical protein